MTDQKSCAERVQAELDGVMETLEILVKLDAEGEYHEELGCLAEYGLSVDYVEPDTFTDQEQGYVRYQLSWGGPSDEFRYYVDWSGRVYHIEYWFMDWFDGAKIILHGKDYDLLEEIFQDFKECGTVEHAREQAES